MVDRIVHICNKVMSVGFSLLFFTTPLLFNPGPFQIFSFYIPIPTNYELFEYNKMMFVYFMTVLIGGAWILKMFIQKRLIFGKTILDIPLGLFYISNVVSTIFSIEPHTSIWGYYSRSNGGLLSITSYLILYYALVSNINILKVTRLILIFIISAFLVSIYGILQRFGIDANRWQQKVQERIFSTLGQPNWLAAYLLTVLPVSLSLFISRKTFIEKAFSFLVSLAIFVAFIYTYSLSAFGAFFIAIVCFVIFLLIQGLKFKKEFVLVPIIFIFVIYFLGKPLWLRVVNQVYFLKNTPAIQKIEKETKVSITPAAGAEETGKIRTIVWKGAIEVAKHYEPFGSGVETFAYAYYQYRPAEHNLTTEWDFLYNKAHNEYLNYLANTGIVGFLTYLSFILTFLGIGFKTILKKKDLFLSGVIAGWISILITNFFGFSVVAVNLLFYLLPGLFLISSKQVKICSVSFDNKFIFKKKFISSNFSKVATLLMVIVSLFLIINIARLWFADTLFGRGHFYSLADMNEEAYPYFKEALDVNSGEPLYFSEFGYTAAVLAAKSTEEKDATSAAKLAIEADNSTAFALSKSPANVNFWKTAARTYYHLGRVDPSYNQRAFKALWTASKLAPTDAKINYNIGTIYGENGMLDEGIKILEETISLKVDYRDAYLTLSEFYLTKKEPKKAREILENYLKIGPDDPEIVSKLREISN